MAWFKTRTVRCNGRKITVFRDPNDAVPIYVGNVTAAAKGSLDLAKGASGEVSGQYKERITGISSLVHNATESFLMEFRILYQYYSESPCERENYFQIKLSELLEERRKFDLVRLHLTTIIDLASSTTSAETVLKRFDMVIMTLTQPIQANEMAYQFAKVPDLVAGWGNQ